MRHSPFNALFSEEKKRQKYNDKSANHLQIFF